MSRGVAPTAKQVGYKLPRYGNVTVERLPRANITGDVASYMLNLVVATYSAQFEAAMSEDRSLARPLSPGAALGKYGTVGAVERQLDMMLRRTAEGGAYWVVAASHEGDRPYSMIALANTTPSRGGVRQRVGLESPNCYLGNVLVDPGEQGKGLGSAVMHAALRFSGYDRDRVVALDALTSNPQALKFFSDCGLDPEENTIVPGLPFPGGERLPQARYSGILSHAVAMLENRIPALANAIAE